jgi:hypothetical protein
MSPDRVGPIVALRYRAMAFSRRSLTAWAGVVIILLLLVSLPIAVTPRIKQRLVRALGERFDSTVQLEALTVSSQLTTGVKSFFLRVVDGLFRHDDITVVQYHRRHGRQTEGRPRPRQGRQRRVRRPCFVADGVHSSLVSGSASPSRR